MTDETQFIVSHDESFAMLGNEVSDAVARSLKRGMTVYAAASVVAQVAADYGRGEYGNQFLPGLAQVVIDRGAMPIPADGPISASDPAVSPELSE